MSFLAELKRRKIYQVAVAYGAIAWSIFIVVSEISDSLEWERVDRVVLIVLAICFPIALALSWLFDWTPEGIVRDTGLREGTHSQAVESGGALSSPRHGAAFHSVRELVASGPMPVSRLLRLAVRMADALANAHANGGVHGALTSASIAVAADDSVEILGLGSAGGEKKRGGDAANGYAAPECARGEPAEFRSDQFSFGAVLYEMATGRRAFVGANKDELLAAVMHAEPEPASRFNPEIPPPLQWIIERCLAKSPKDRYASTRDLHADLASIAESVAIATSARLAPKHNLPAQRTALVGREHELNDASRLVLDETTRLLTLTGPGGIGKTRMLIELGRKLSEDFKGGVFFVPLDRVQDAELVTSEIAKSLDVKQVPEHSIEEVLYRHLRQYCVTPTLLLIDNFEQVLEAAPLLSRLLEASGQLKIVVTSRAALHLYGEHEHRVAPLLVADQAADAEHLVDSPAIKLFLERAASLPDKLDEADLRIIADICTRLDGLPLAIELAAARTKVLSLQSLLERITDPLKLLSGGPRDLPARQQTLRATLEWSYELLDMGQRKLFRRFGVFVGGATLEAIEAVCNVDEDLDIDLIEAVESLVDNSLLRSMEVDTREQRFTMLETMREYALSQLAEAGEEAHTRKAHAAYCLVLAQESTYVQAAGDWQKLYERFDRETGNLRAALDWLIQTGDGDWGVKLAHSLGHYWVQRARAQEGYERMVRLLPLAKEDSDERIYALCWAGDFAANIGRWDEHAKQYHLDALALARARQNIPALLRCLNSLAVNRQQAGQLESAKAYHEEAVGIARKEGAPPAVLGGMLGNYAGYAMLCGDFDLAQRLHEETMQLFVEVGNEAALAWSLNRLGDVARERGDGKTARARYEESLSKFRELGDKGGTAGCLYDLAVLIAAAGGWGAAEKFGREALSIYRELGQIAYYPRVFEALSRCALGLGEPERALTLAAGAAAMRQAQSISTQSLALEAVNRCVESARELLTDTDATAHWMAGWRMPPEQAIAFALREQDGPTPAKPSGATSPLSQAP
jgi:predicted ATPase